MSLTDYEQQGGFKEELNHVRMIGTALNLIEDKVTGERAFREPERQALHAMRAALESLRGEIVQTLNMARGQK